MASDQEQSRRDSPAATSGEAKKPVELEFIPINFTIGGDDILKGYQGLPSYIFRARGLEDGMDRFWNRVAGEHAEIRADASGPVEFARRWTARIEEIDLGTIERIVRDYNEYFPIEANLPMDPLTGRFVFRGQPFVKAVAPTREDVLRRFPLDGSGPRES